MADASTGGAPASNGADGAAALPEGMLSVPKITVDKRAGTKLSPYDLEIQTEDEPIVQRPPYKKEEEDKPKVVPKKAEAPVELEPEEDETEEETDEEEEVKPVKKKKQAAMDLIDDDEDEDGKIVEASDDENKTVEQAAEDPSKVDSKELDKKYKISVKDGDKTVEKDYSLKQLIAMAQKNETGDLKLYQASEAYKKVENVVDRLKSEPFEVLKYIAGQTNQDYYKMIEAEYANQFKLNMMKPEERQAFLQAEQDKRDLQNFRQQQEDLKIKMAQEELTRTQQKIANDFVEGVGNAIQGNEYLKRVYDGLDEGNDKNYIIKKFGEMISNGLLMKQRPKGDPHHLDPNFDLSPSNPIIIDLIVKQIKEEATQQVKQAQKAQKLIDPIQAPEAIVNAAGTKVREKIPGVKPNSGITKKVTSKAKHAKKQSTHDFLRELLY